jgi:hypothetical protein
VGGHWRGAARPPPATRWLAALRRGLPAGAAAPHALHIDDERLLGGLDLAATLASGRPVRLPGLLAQTDARRAAAADGRAAERPAFSPAGRGAGPRRGRGFAQRRRPGGRCGVSPWWRWTTARPKARRCRRR